MSYTLNSPVEHLLLGRQKRQDKKETKTKNPGQKTTKISKNITKLTHNKLQETQKTRKHTQRTQTHFGYGPI